MFPVFLCQLFSACYHCMFCLMCLPSFLTFHLLKWSVTCMWVCAVSLWWSFQRCVLYGGATGGCLEFEVCVFFLCFITRFSCHRKRKSQGKTPEVVVCFDSILRKCTRSTMFAQSLDQAASCALTHWPDRQTIIIYHESDAPAKLYC